MSCSVCCGPLSGIGPENSPRKRVLQFIGQMWDEEDQERFLEIADSDEHELMPGLKVENFPDENRFITTPSKKPFIWHQERVLNKLSDEQVNDLCILIKILGSAKMMDCESMVSFPAQGFWLNNKGKPVIFHAR
jgi:hypothetical protein